MGALTELHYPTGGHTKFEYELHKRKKLTTEFKRLNVFLNKENQNDRPARTLWIGSDPNFNSDLLFPGGTNNIPSPGVFDTQEINVMFKVNAPNAPSYTQSNPDHNYQAQLRHFVKFKVTDHSVTPETVEYAELSDAQFNRINLCCF